MSGARRVEVEARIDGRAPGRGVDPSREDPIPDDGDPHVTAACDAFLKNGRTDRQLGDVLARTRVPRSGIYEAMWRTGHRLVDDHTTMALDKGERLVRVARDQRVRNW